MMGALRGGSGVWAEATRDEGKCKPDYERMLKSQKESLVVEQNLYDALLAYGDRFGETEAICLMLGELLVGIRRRNKDITRIMEQQEQEG